MRIVFSLVVGEQPKRLEGEDVLMPLSTWQFLKIGGGPQYRLQHLRILVIGTPRRYPEFGETLTCSHEGAAVITVLHPGLIL